MGSDAGAGLAGLSIDDLILDTNGDGYPDDLRARIVLDGTPAPELWAAILDLAARLGLETSGFTPPLITPAPTPAQLPIVVSNGDAERFTRLARGWQGREAIAAAGPRAVEQLARLGQQAAAPGEPQPEPPAALDLRELFETGGLLVDGGDGLPVGTRLSVVIPPSLPAFVGRALADFAARLGVESGGVTLPVATTGEPPAWAIPLRLNLQTGAETELRVVPGPALELAGDPEQAAYLIDTLARDWPRLPGLPAAAEAVDWPRRSLAGWTPAGRAALLHADLPDAGSEPIRLLVADASERAALRETARQALGTGADVREPEDALLVMREEWSAPWEVERALAALRDTIVPQLAPGQPVALTIFVSEPAGVRRALAAQAKQVLAAGGFPEAGIQVLDAFKPGLCWLREVVLPRWRGLRGVARVVVGYRPLEQHGDRALDYPTRWLQELFPADEFIAEALDVPLEAVALEAWDGPATYAVEALDSAGQVLAHEELSLFSYERPYLDAFPEKGTVTVTTGGLAARQGERVVHEAVFTDLDEFWGFFQGVVLPRLGAAILQATGGDPRAAEQPLFDRLDIEVTLSETDETLGIREEWNSAAEALHEDIYFVALDYVEALGEQVNGERLSGPGSVVPLVHVRPGAGPSARVTLRARAGAVARTEGEGEGEPRPLGLLGSAPVGEAQLTAVGVEGDHLRLGLELGGLDDPARRTLAALATLHPPEPGRPVLEVRLEDGTRLRLAPPRPDALPVVEPARRPTPDGEIVTEANLYPLLARLASRPEVRVALAERSYQGRPIPAIEVTAPVTADVWSARKLSLFKPTLLVVARHHANEVAATSAALKLVERLTEDPEWRSLLRHVNVAVIPYENPDGAELHALLQQEHPTWKHHPARYNAVGLEISLDRGKPDSRYGEARVRDTLWRRWLPDAVVDNHGFNSHEWVQPFSGYGAAVRFRTYWIVPSIVWGASWYLDDERFPEHRQATEAVREAVTRAMAADAELLALNRRYFERFETWAHSRLPDKYPTERHHDMTFYSRSLDERRRGWGGYAVQAPRVTVFTSITEVPDETAHGAHLERTARADLVNNRAILDLLAAAAGPLRRTIVAGPDSLRISLARRRPIRLGEPAATGEDGEGGGSTEQ
ncbi:MAG TPA: M14 family metallopeptidase [Thermomicrobiaceae bacterium]|nr:M14 family metallopeptidase [Thermomicrobiaceae bacterium]